MRWFIVAGGLCCLIYWSYGRKFSRLSALQIPFWTVMGGKSLSCFSLFFLRLFDVLTILFFSLTILYCLAGSGPFPGLQSYFSEKKIPSFSLSKKTFFVVDRSGSMAEPMSGSLGLSKMEIVKEAISSSIEDLDRKGGWEDFFGLATFARATKVVAPLTRDRAFFEEVLASVNPEIIEALNGTAIGYAIFKAATLIVACSEEGSGKNFSQRFPTFNSMIVLITDGLEEPHPADYSHPYRSMRSLQALSFAKENHLKVHYLCVDKTAYERMTVEERDLLIQAIEATGGSYHEALGKDQIFEILQGIISHTSAEETGGEFDLSEKSLFILVTATLISLFTARIMETVVLRIAR